jgi:hypothetical protein
MPFNSAHVSLVSFAVDITPAEAVDVMVVETDLHLNPRHPAYNAGTVRRLIVAAQDYLAVNAGRATLIRLVSNRSGEI